VTTLRNEFGDAEISGDVSGDVPTEKGNVDCGGVSGDIIIVKTAMRHYDSVVNFLLTLT